MSGERRPRGNFIDAEPRLGEVEELLRAAHDDLLLNLSVDTHTTSSSPLDPDLSRRLDALRSHPRPEHSDAPAFNPRDAGAGAPPTAATAAAGDETRGGRSLGEDEMSKVLGDDLAARFATLKASSSCYFPTGKPDKIPSEDNEEDEGSDESDDDDNRVSKKEVEKLMQWAMDAARLDPDRSNSDDDLRIGKEEEEGEGGESEQDDEEDGAAREEEKRKKEKQHKAEVRLWKNIGIGPCRNPCVVGKGQILVHLILPT